MPANDHQTEANERTHRVVAERYESRFLTSSQGLALDEMRNELQIDDDRQTRESTQRAIDALERIAE